MQTASTRSVLMARGDEGQEGAGGAVGPVDVLEQQQDRLLAAEALQQREQRLEQAPLGGAGAVVRARPRRGTGLADVGEQRRELGPRGLAELVEHRVLVARERPQRGDQRRVGQLALAQLHALAAERARPAVLRARAASSEARRDLPTPDSPATNAIEGWPSEAAAKAASSSASSAVRPISRVLVTRVAKDPQVSRAGPAGTGAVTRTAGNTGAGAGFPCGCRPEGETRAPS